MHICSSRMCVCVCCVCLAGRSRRRCRRRRRRNPCTRSTRAQSEGAGRVGLLSLSLSLLNGRFRISLLVGASQPKRREEFISTCLPAKFLPQFIPCVVSDTPQTTVPSSRASAVAFDAAESYRAVSYSCTCSPPPTIPRLCVRLLVLARRRSLATIHRSFRPRD